MESPIKPSTESDAKIRSGYDVEEHCANEISAFLSLSESLELFLSKYWGIWMHWACSHLNYCATPTFLPTLWSCFGPDDAPCGSSTPGLRFPPHIPIVLLRSHRRTPYPAQCPEAQA
ncbi:hypothetical protein Hypma_004445 [Hypsizygus marmoreus]|uniref:Uncharacterized protein n=1 Tax=Hypsizygus marmoreus TaxID=39966 RepID=A0A369K8U5_HYPMA|nr:hypothetical protein Hypma_004445 [Hypsizygus marmoreus]